MCGTDPVGPGELRLLNLEVEKSRQGDGIEKPGSETDNHNEKECQTKTGCTFCQHDINAKQTQVSPEEVDNTLEVSRDQHQKRDNSGEDQGWRWSQSVDVSHGQNIWLQSTTQVRVKHCDNRLTLNSLTYVHK